MLHVALTGNIASGKSTVARLFRRWGATVIDADRIVHELERPGTGVFQQIVARFGPAVVRGDGTLDRAALRHRVADDPDSRRALEAIVHPAVEARRQELLEEAAIRRERLVVSDIPLLFERLDPARFDAVVLVHAPAELRRRRLVEERHLDPSEADRLIAMQIPSEHKRSRSDIVVDNTGTLEDLERAARRAWEALATRATQ